MLTAKLAETDFRVIDPAMAEIGADLFFDPILSGNRNIACSSCHHPDFGGSDGLSLGFGEGGDGIGPERRAGEAIRRLQRNAPGLFNLGFTGVDTLFHDGRLSLDPDAPRGINSPAVELIPEGLDSLVAAQALFPLISAAEMAGQRRENAIAGAVARRVDYAWDIVVERVANIDGYSDRFVATLPEVDHPTGLRIEHIANALAAFIEFNWRSYRSPFDQWLAGDDGALSSDALAGAQLFFGEANCVRCHSGPLFSDQAFYNLGLPRFGPGRTRLFDHKARDMGRINESDRPEDAYRFRTPGLRNVADTAPYGHNGAWPSLRDILEQHRDPVAKAQSWRPADAELPQAPARISATDLLIRSDRTEAARAARTREAGLALSERDIDVLIAFLESLSDPIARAGEMPVPDTVPSGLPVQR